MTISELSTRTWAHAAVTAALEAGLLEDPGRADGAVEQALADVLVALELAQPGDPPESALGRALEPPFGDALAAELRSDRQQTAALVEDARLGDLRAGWRRTDPELLDAQGETGRALRFAAQMLLPGLEGLEERLGSDDGRFLDVGCGVGVVSIELCRMYPGLCAVGLEPLAEARRLAEEKIAEAGLAGRVEVRDQLVEDLDERDAYDFSFVPSVFLGEAFEDGLAAVHRALRSGAWVLVITGADTDDPLEAAVRRLRLTLWGGTPRSSEEIADALSRHGFTDAFVPPATGAYQPVVARKPMS